MTAKAIVRPTRPNAPTPKRAPADTRFDVANRVFFRLYQASNLMHRTGTRAVSAHGATTQQWAVMGALSRSGVTEVGMSVKELMALLAVSRQSLTMVLNRMEGIGLIERVKLQSDGRIRRIRLTKAGIATWKLMLDDIRNYYATAIEDFSTADANALFVLLDRLTTSLSRL
jgi:MarR family transcriptional regulator, organic hydroperoxide resistance regulator